MSSRALMLATAAALCGCAAGAGPSRMMEVEPPPSNGRPAQPDGWDRAVTLQTPRDLDPTPNVVEFDLDAQVGGQTFLPGTTTPAWTYNGTVPGPLIRAHVGDHLIVALHEHLPEDSTVHWHGIRLPSTMDGVPGHTQPPVLPGGTFDYEFNLPDAGLFWYHPHVDSAGAGRRRALRRDPRRGSGARTRAGLAPFGDDLVLVLSDIDLRPDGSLLDPMSTSGGDFGTLFGREGTRCSSTVRSSRRSARTPACGSAGAS